MINLYGVNAEGLFIYSLPEKRHLAKRISNGFNVSEGSVVIHDTGCHVYSGCRSLMENMTQL